ncbi:MAG: nucleotidyltransferase family protein [Clostridiales bacterium]|nr:nucleotidyltransferase family protein [Clostridiales bacterium]
MDAILLAGGDAGKLGLTLCPSNHRALTPIAGRPMIEYVVEALRASERVKRLIIVGELSALQPLYSDADDIVLLQGGGSIVTNALIGLEQVEGYALIATVDIPLVTGPVIDAFIAQCEEAGPLDFYYPVLSRQTNEAAYPAAKRTYFRLAEGNFTGGNIIMVNAAVAGKNKAKITALVEHRKSAVKMALDVGLIPLFKMLIGRLPLSGAEKAVRKILNITGKAVVSLTPEIGLDVDKPSDWEAVSEILGKKEL